MCLLTADLLLTGCITGKGTIEVFHSKEVELVTDTSGNVIARRTLAKDSCQVKIEIESKNRVESKS